MLLFSWFVNNCFRASVLPRNCFLPQVRWGRASTCYAACQYGRISQSSPRRRGRRWWGAHLQPVSSHPAWTFPLTLPSGLSLRLDHQPTWKEGREGGIVKYLIKLMCHFLLGRLSLCQICSLNVQVLHNSSCMVPVGQWDGVSCGLGLLLTLQFGFSSCLKLFCQGS